MSEPLPRNACELLDADHLAVKHLFVEYARLAYAPVADPNADRAAIARRICDELTTHADIEEAVFYPALRDAAPGAADVLDDAEAQHAEARSLIARIRRLEHAGAEMDALVAELAGAIGDHVKEERDALFPKALSSAGLDVFALGARLEERRQALTAASR